MALVLLFLTRIVGIAHANSNNYFLFNHNEDIWKKIITDGHLDSHAVHSIFKTDKIRHRLVNNSGIIGKMKLEYDIKCAIIELQESNHSLIEDCHIFKKSSPQRLMEQYLYGFYGELMSFFCFDLVIDSKKSWMRDKVVRIDKLLTEHRVRYNLTIPPKSMFFNATVEEIIKYQEFMVLQQESERLLTKIQAVFGQFSGEYACNSRLMMQAIGLRIGFPESMEFDRYPRWGLAIICRNRNRHIAVMWRDLLHFGLRFNDSLFARKLTFAAILKQVPEANIICDSVITLLDKIDEKFLELSFF